MVFMRELQEINSIPRYIRTADKLTWGGLPVTKVYFSIYRKVLSGTEFGMFGISTFKFWTIFYNNSFSCSELSINRLQCVWSVTILSKYSNAAKYTI